MSLRTSAGLFAAALLLSGVALVNCGSSNEVAVSPSDPKPPPPDPDPAPTTPKPGPTDTGDPPPPEAPVKAP